MKINKIIFMLLCLPIAGIAQIPSKEKNEIYIDAKGILRLQSNNKEASYFGVNYTLPFAYGFRSHKKLGIDLEKAIDDDVYHLARLGIDAFRVHVWDTEISDSLGNLKNNEHLRLFDYLISKLEERNIRILITPIAFWGNGYPDQDEKTGSFVELYTKEGAVVTEKAFLAQERYLGQFFRHVNPYTKKSYAEDSHIIAAEINNEPKHSGPKSLTTTYVNRMVKAVRETGWNKPIFYNISESPTYADAVAKSNADGFSFQWYPTGLVAGHEQQGNLLPLVDKYHIPFDTIPEFKNKPRMIYEFESADVLQPYMYPAMARSFKSAGMQWATQFAYDPMGTAYANTEYQTHYLNLAYTPSKAISLMIASKVFHSVPAFKDLGTFPANTEFAAVKLDYRNQAAELNTGENFYYTSGTLSKPVNIQALTQVAGVGSSTIVKYGGNGAYFLDKLKEGVWRLEVMPDVKRIKDPFGKNELDKPVTTTVWNEHPMDVLLPDLGQDFDILPLNAGNSGRRIVGGHTFKITPGTYLLRNKSNRNFKIAGDIRVGNLLIQEFVAPTKVYGTDLPKAETLARTSHDSLLLFDGSDKASNLTVFSPEWKTDPYEFSQSAEGNALLKLKHSPSAKGQLGGLQIYVTDLIKGEIENNLDAAMLVIRITSDQLVNARINLIGANASARSTVVAVGKSGKQLTIPLKSFKPGNFMLLPRPYPGFQPMFFRAADTDNFQLKDLEKIQVLLEGGKDQENEVRLESIVLKDYLRVQR
jgi:hypothetical protein